MPFPISHVALSLTTPASFFSLLSLVVAGILRSTYYAPPDRDTFEVILKFMEHFGLARKAA